MILIIEWCSRLLGWLPADAGHTHDQRVVRPYLYRLVVGRPYKGLDYSGHRGSDAIYLRKDTRQKVAGNAGRFSDPCGHSGWDYAADPCITGEMNMAITSNLCYTGTDGNENTEV